MFKMFQTTFLYERSDLFTLSKKNLQNNLFLSSRKSTKVNSQLDEAKISITTLVHLVTFLEIILAFRKGYPININFSIEIFTSSYIRTYTYMIHFYAIIIVDKYLKLIITPFHLLCSIVAEHKQRWALTL